jgi:predicted ATPase
MARLDRLGPAAKEAAQVGAAIGREFAYELLASVVHRSNTEQLQAALDRLVGAGLLFQRGTPPAAVYTFKHALVQDAAYGTLLRGARRWLHAAIAQALEERFPERAEAEPERLAQHCAQADWIDKAVGYWLTAGQRAVVRSAMTEAVAQLRKGLALLASVPDGAAHQQHELDLQIALGRALMATQGYAASATGESFARASWLCQRLNSPPQLVPVLMGQSAHHMLRGELDLAYQRAEEMRRLGEARRDTNIQSLGCRLGGEVRLALGEFTAAHADFQRSLELFDPAQRSEIAALTAADTYVVTLAGLSATLIRLGYLDQARVRRDEALAEARQLSHAFTLALALNSSCVYERCVQAAPAALRDAEELVALTTEQGFPFWRAVGTLYIGWSLAAMGRPADALALLSNGLAAYHAIGSVVYLPFWLVTLAGVYAKVGRPEEGLNQLDEAGRLIEATQARVVEAEIHRCRGELLVSLDDHIAAEDSFRAALAVAQRQRAKLWELLAATSLARLWRDQAKRDEARDLLASVYGWFTEGFDTPDLKQAKALLNELSK